MKAIWNGVVLAVGGEQDPNAAWTYRHPFPWVRKIRDHVAFWGDVEIRE
jgi:uncharacterized protein (DUF427 family)